MQHGVALQLLQVEIAEQLGADARHHAVLPAAKQRHQREADLPLLRWPSCKLTRELELVVFLLLLLRCWLLLGILAHEVLLLLLRSPSIVGVLRGTLEHLHVLGDVDFDRILGAVLQRALKVRHRQWAHVIAQLRVHDPNERSLVLLAQLHVEQLRIRGNLARCTATATAACACLELRKQQDWFVR